MPVRPGFGIRGELAMWGIAGDPVLYCCTGEHANGAHCEPGNCHRGVSLEVLERDRHGEPSLIVAEVDTPAGPEHVRAYRGTRNRGAHGPVIRHSAPPPETGSGEQGAPLAGGVDYYRLDFKPGNFFHPADK